MLEGFDSRETMIHHRFARLYDSDSEYNAAVGFWRVFFLDILLANQQAGDWFDWGLREFADGSSPPRDLSPILQQRSNRLKRSVQILQGPPQKERVEIGAHVQHLTFYREPENVWQHTDELVINLALSDEALPYVKALIEQWLDESVSLERMEDLIEKLLPVA